MLFNSEDSPTSGSRKVLRLRYALTFTFITASTAALLLCPCDLPGRNPRALPLIVLSAVFGLAAAGFLYRLLQRYTGITILLRALYAGALVVIGVYVEFDIATNLIAWMARSR
jgi:hypothetical protein